MKHTIDNYTFSILRKRVKTLENIGVSETIKLKDVGTSGAPTIVNQTGEEIKTLYEAELNAYTDIKNTAFLTGLTKLTGIEAGADVTDIVNVNAAGAVMKLNYNANTLLYAVDDNTPVVKTRAEVMGLLSGQAAADFAMNTHKITGVVDPTAAQDVATKAYGDANWAGGGGDWVLFNVMDYGAYKDGTHATATTTAWTNAINAANSTSFTPGIVFAPPGEYLITPGSLPAVDCNIYAPGVVVQAATNANLNLFHLTYTLYYPRFFEIGAILGFCPNAKDGSARTVYLWRLTGTTSVGVGSNAVTGSGTAFNSEAAIGDPIFIEEEEFTINTITDNTHLTLSGNHVAGASGKIAYMNPPRTGIGIFYDQGYECTFNIDRLQGFSVGLKMDNTTTNSAVTENVFESRSVSYNNTGIWLNNGSAAQRIEANRFQILYMVLNWNNTIGLNSNVMCNDNYFEILNLELHHRMGNGIYLNGTNCFRNAFILPNKITRALGAGKMVKTTGGAHDNFFRLAYCNFDETSIGAGNVLDLLSNEFQGNEPDIGATINSARSQFMRSAVPTGAANYFREGDICWNNSPSDGTLCWVCTVSGSPGTWNSISTSGGVSDKISEGDSYVEVIDAGTGSIDFRIDGTQRALLNSSGFMVATSHININPSSGDATLYADGAAVANYGILRLSSNGVERAYFSANNAYTYIGITGGLQFRLGATTTLATLDSSGNFSTVGTLGADTIAAGTSDYNKFLVSDAGIIKYRTGTQIASDIGAIDTSGVPVDNDFAKFTDANTIEGRSYTETRNDLGLGTGNSPVFSEVSAQPSSGNALVYADGAVAANYGAFYCNSGGGSRAFLSANNANTTIGYTGNLTFEVAIGGANRAILSSTGNLQLDGTLTENAWTLDKKITDRKWELIDSMLDAYKEHDGRYLDPALQVKAGNKWGKRPSDFIQIAIECIAELKTRIEVLENKKIT